MSVFISYSRKDEDFVRSLHDFLEASGLDVWFDSEQPAGTRWWNSILDHIRGANVIVFVMSRTSSSSRACRRELEYAGALEREIVPIRIDGVGTEEGPPEVASRQILEFDGPTTIDWGHLAQAVRQADAPRTLPNPLPEPPDPPIADLEHARRKLDENHLDHVEQHELMDELLAVAEDRNDRPHAVRLMKRLCERDEVLKVVSDRLTHYLRTVEPDEGRQIPPAVRRLVEDLRNQRCMPILGSGVSSWLFGERREMAQKWAAEYPFHVTPGPRDDLPQIAQFAAVTYGDSAVRTDLRIFYEEQLARNHRRVKEQYPDADLDQLAVAVWDQTAEDRPLELHRLFAQFPCSIYLTTEVNSLLTQALEEAGRRPRTDFCRWRDEHFENTDFEADDWLNLGGYRPTVEEPYVLHIFGTLREPDSIVITEDEYLDFLAQVSLHPLDRVLPYFIVEALAEKSLLFTGFGLQDWNMRILLRSVVDRCTVSRRGNRLEHLATDQPPTRRGARSPDSAKKYMVRYFNRRESPIEIEWSDVDAFAVDLARAWEEFG